MYEKGLQPIGCFDECWGNETHHPLFLEVFRKNSEMSWPILWRHDVDAMHSSWLQVKLQKKQPLQTCREWICMSAFGVFCSYTPKSIGCLLKTMLISGVPQFIRDIPKCIWIYKWQAKERCSGWELCTRNGSQRSKDIPIPGASASSVMQATLQRWERNSKRVENRLAPWKALWAFGPNFDEASTTVAITIFINTR